MIPIILQGMRLSSTGYAIINSDTKEIIRKGRFVTTNKDSLLSFNEAECFYDYIENNMTGGPYVRISNISRTFQYTYLEPNDTIQWIIPLSNTMELALSNIDSFKQVKITQILK